MAEMKVICAWCGKNLGVKQCTWTDGAVSHGICDDCLKETLNEVEVVRLENSQKETRSRGNDRLLSISIGEDTHGFQQ